jgi:hypothetical protein
MGDVLCEGRRNRVPAREVNMRKLVGNAIRASIVLSSLWLPVGSAVGQTFSRWTSITPDQRQYATQPGGVMPLVVQGSTNFAAGRYMIHVAVSNPDGKAVARWNSFGPVELHGNDKWVMSLLPEARLRLEHNSADTLSYSSPGPNRAMIYARNLDTRSWQSICVLPVGIAVQPNCFWGCRQCRAGLSAAGGHELGAARNRWGLQWHLGQSGYSRHQIVHPCR